MHIQPSLYSRSASEANSSGNGGGLGENTIIFIILGVVCLLVILIGFYLVSRRRVASNASPNVPSSHQHHSPLTPTFHTDYAHDVTEGWKIRDIWRHTRRPAPPIIVESPTSQLSPIPAAITRPPRIRVGSKTYPPIIPRPAHARRVTSLSVATSFSRSHITEEALSEFRASAYDLDGDLETEMLHSATDDVWVGHPLAVGGTCGHLMEEPVDAGGDALEGCVEGDVPTSRTAARWRGGDYETFSACQDLQRSGGAEVMEIGKLAAGGALQT